MWSDESSESKKAFPWFQKFKESSNMPSVTRKNINLGSDTESDVDADF